MTTRILHIPHAGYLDRMAQHVRRLVAQDRSVLIITTNRPGVRLLPDLKERDVDTRRVFVVDAAADPNSVPADPEHLHLIPNPTLLELIAARTERIIRSKAEGPPHVLVDNVNTFALYNEPETLEELIRYTVHHLLDAKTTVDFLVDTDAPLPKELERFLTGFVDVVTPIDALNGRIRQDRQAAPSGTEPA